MIGGYLVRHSPSNICFWAPLKNSGVTACEQIVESTNYRSEHGHIQVSASCVTVSNPDSLSSSGTGVTPGIRKPRKALICMRSMWENHWWYLFHKKVKSWDSTTWFKIWQFQTTAWERYLQVHLQDEKFVFFFRVMIGVFWKRESRPIECHPFRLLALQRFPWLHAYSLCEGVTDREVYDWPTSSSVTAEERDLQPKVVGITLRQPALHALVERL